MASSSKEWARTISRCASRIYFLVIILQLPLFRFPCGIGKCTTPLDVTLPQLIASKILPMGIVKALLYPGVVVSAIFKNKDIPSYNKSLHVYKFNNEASGFTDIKHLEFLVGCYLAVAGSFLGLIRPSRLSLIGLFLIIWGIVKEIFFGKYLSRDSSKGVFIYSTMWIAVFSAFFSIRGDVRKLIRSCGFSKAKFK